MSDISKAALQAASPYNAAITREQFLFYEVRTTAKLLNEGYNSEEVMNVSFQIIYFNTRQKSRYGRWHSPA